jgi:hypothetical protein
VPTAKQLLGLAHDTPVRMLRSVPSGLGPVASDQVVPSHCSIKFVPTATQLVALEHDTLSSALLYCGGLFGLGTTDQVVPFHCSTRVCWAAWSATENAPTAKQFVTSVHETPERMLPAAPAGIALALVDQRVPFHCSMKAPLAPLPTAKQLVELGHDTLTTSAMGGPGRFGLVSTDSEGAAPAAGPRETTALHARAAAVAARAQPRAGVSLRPMVKPPEACLECITYAAVKQCRNLPYSSR